MDFWPNLVSIFGSNFAWFLAQFLWGFDGESMKNMIGTGKLIFGRVFDEGYFGPNF